MATEPGPKSVAGSRGLLVLYGLEMKGKSSRSLGVMVLETRVRAGKIERRRRCARCRFHEPTIEVPKRIWEQLTRLANRGAPVRELVLKPGEALRIVAGAR